MGQSSSRNSPPAPAVAEAAPADPTPETDETSRESSTVQLPHSAPQNTPEQSTPPSDPPPPVPEPDPEANLESVIPRRIVVQGTVIASIPHRPASNDALLNEFLRDFQNVDHTPAPGDPVALPSSPTETNAALIAHLLCVAAATTAATLLPGGIVLSGSQVQGFDDSASTSDTSARLRAQLAAPLPIETPVAVVEPEEVVPLLSEVERTVRRPSATRFASVPTILPSFEATATTTIARPRRSRAASLPSLLPVTSASPFLPPRSNSLIPLRRSSNPILPVTHTSPLASPRRQSEVSAAPEPSPPLPELSAPARPTLSSILPSLPEESSPRPTSASPVEGEAQTVFAVPLPETRVSIALEPESLEEGSFEHFLSTMRIELGRHILDELESTQGSRTFDPTPEAQDSEASDASPNLGHSSESGNQTGSTNTRMPNQPFYSFHRSFRFPMRYLDVANSTPSDSSNPDSLQAFGIPIDPSSATQPSSNDPANADDLPETLQRLVPLLSDPPAEESPPVASTPPTEENGTARRLPVVPLIFLGVRSVQNPDSSSESQTSRPASETTEEDRESNDSGFSELPFSDVSEGDELPHARPVPRTPSRTWILWIMAGVYPPSHPLVLAPSLANDQLTYETMIRLAELLGNVKPPTVTADEIQKSNLRTVSFSEMVELQKRGEIKENTCERCLICLEDYEADEELRLLNCQHIFHQTCCDRWLQEGRNSCPACRTTGVPKEEKPNETNDRATNTEQNAVLSQ